MSTTTMSISLDINTRNDIEDIAKEERISRSDVVRSLVRKYKLEREINKASNLAKSKMKEYNIQSWDDLEALLG
jgi:metal-responsive CopG/Arc/MetJ family transcriptional regulator